MTAERAESAAEAQSVRPLELFFDLVFVFTVTQIASVLAARPDLAGLGRTALLLSLTWWMYGGYAWLTNALDLERTGPRLLLLTGTAGFFVMSMAVPRAVGKGPWALVFGAAYLSVVTVHAAGFIGSSGHRGITRIGPVNLAGALVVLAAGAVPQQQRAWVWGAAVAVQWCTPFLSRARGFTVGVGHFVERHGLAVIIMLGESITEVGAAAAHQDSPGRLVLAALLALAVSAALWWLYFDREEQDSAARLERVPVHQRPRAAAYSFGYAYLLLIFGIAVAAVGMQESVERLDGPLHGLPAVLLPLGAALYLAGLACFHRVLAATWSGPRLAAAGAVLLAGIPAQHETGRLGLAVTALLLGTLAAWEHTHSTRRS